MEAVLYQTATRVSKQTLNGCSSLNRTISSERDILSCLQFTRTTV